VIGREVGRCGGLKEISDTGDDVLMRRMICLSDFATCNKMKSGEGHSSVDISIWAVVGHVILHVCFTYAKYSPLVDLLNGNCKESES